MIKLVKVAILNGIHARTAALICSAASKLNEEFGTQIYIRKDGVSPVPATNMLALNYLKIQNKDTISVIVNGDNDQKVMNLIEPYFTSDKMFEIKDYKSFDSTLDRTTIQSEKIIETLHNGVLLIDMKFEVLLINDAAKSLISQSKESLIGQNIFNSFPSEIVSILTSNDEHQAKKIIIYNKTLLIDTYFVLQEDISIGKVAIIKDITTSEQLADQLDSTNKVKDRLGNILNNISDGVCMIDENGFVTYVNPSFEKIFNQQPEEFIGKRINKINFPILYEGYQQQIPIINNIKILDNSQRAIVSISPVMIDDTFKGCIASFILLNDARQMARRLKLAEEQIQKLEIKLKLKNPIDQAFKIIIGESKVLYESLRIASKVAKKKASVMIVGESGTGKELFAKAIHEASPRSGQPFIKVNCAAIPENLLESVLFGHKKGSFTGAIKDQKGQFELANSGTLFLDEIGELPLNLQPKILRVLQDFEITPIGDAKTHKVDIRIIVATNKDLEVSVKNGNFREDLYYRLNVIPIYLPTLRERTGDIPLLVDFLLNKIQLDEDGEAKKISSDALEILEEYDWPGNIRELENLLLRSVILTDGDMIYPEILPKHIKSKILKTPLINMINGELNTYESYDREIIKLALIRYGSFNKAAKALGLAHRTISLKAKKYGLVKK